jgi:hypothetical protein
MRRFRWAAAASYSVAAPLLLLFRQQVGSHDAGGCLA